jgi:hypothetical protein
MLPYYSIPSVFSGGDAMQKWVIIMSTVRVERELQVLSPVCLEEIVDDFLKRSVKQ